MQAQQVYLCTKYEVQQMLKQDSLDWSPSDERKERAVRGSIVNTCSLSGTASVPTLSCYNSVKHAVASMTKVDARQYAPHGIRVNAVSPGFTLTPMLMGGGAGVREEFYTGSKAQSPMNRLTFPEEIAETVCFLSGLRASGITGVNLQVDAGASLFHVI
jgi:NAD(P)-dependent dehydrogenase (short-subunit alcohol dehydrogenase family)